MNTLEIFFTVVFFILTYSAAFFFGYGKGTKDAFTDISEGKENPNLKGTKK